MNVMWYVAKFDEATWQLFCAIGLTPSRLRAGSMGMAGVEQHIEYKRELHAGDVVTVSSAILEVKQKAIRFAHEMKTTKQERWLRRRFSLLFTSIQSHEGRAPFRPTFETGRTL